MVNGHSANQKNGEENGGGSGRVRNDTTGSLDEGECHVDPYYQKKHLNTQECGKVNVDIGEFDSMTESRLLVLYTGGTIGMRKVDGSKENIDLLMIIIMIFFIYFSQNVFYFDL